ncbi:MAG: T9SS type A sorting domain-containing protein [Bacteroidia bacterium]
MKNVTLPKKLKAYSAIAGSLLAAANQADAQIVYTDVSPDSTVAGDGNSFYLDMDNDGTYDFQIGVTINATTAYTSQRVSITAQGSNAVAGDTVGMYVYPFAMNSGDTVQAAQQFNYGSNQSMASYFLPGGSQYGNWVGVTDKYLGLSFYIGAQRHFGWARLNVNATGTQFTIKDYAYNAWTDEYIICGQTTAGIAEHQLPKDLNVFSHDKNIVIKFDKEVPPGAAYRVTNVMGQELMNGVISDVQTTLQMDKENTGIYFVTVNSSKDSFTQKVYIR